MVELDVSSVNGESQERIIPTWNDIREEIERIDDYEIQMSLKITYLFGTTLDEIIRKTSVAKGGMTVRGNDFFVESINDEDLLMLSIPTARRGRQIRTMAIPLNPKIEEWSSEILDYSESIADKWIYKNVARQLQDHINKKCFNAFEWPSPTYKEKKEKDIIRVSITHRHISESREWELGLCYNFNEFDFRNFFGEIYKPDYNVYIKKLLRKIDYYNEEDIRNAIDLKKTIFIPYNVDKYYYKEYLEIIKKIKRGYITLSEPIRIQIDPALSIRGIKGGSGGTEDHKLLKANVMKILEDDSNQVIDELGNFDIVDLENGIVAECGNTSSRKLLDSFSGTQEYLKNVQKFWILQIYDSSKVSNLHKFQKTAQYR